MKTPATEWAWNYIRELAHAWLPASVLGGVSWVGHLFGMPHVGTALVLGLTVLDWIAGLYLARLTRTFSYSRARKGLTKTMVWFMVLIVAAWLRSSPGEKVLLAFSEWLVFGMVYLELLSVIKNARAIGTARLWDTSALAAIEQHISRFDPRAMMSKRLPPPEPEVTVDYAPTLRFSVQGRTVELEGVLDLHTTQDLRELVTEMLKASPPVRLDLSRVQYCDSSGLAAFLSMARVARELGLPVAAIEIYYPQAQLSRVFHFTGLDKVLNVTRVEGDKYA